MYKKIENEGVAEEDEDYSFDDTIDESQLITDTLKHDELFRDLLNNKEEFAIFLNNFLSLDFDVNKNNLEKYNRSFITKDYNSRFSDIVFKLKDENLFFLVEHQTAVDYSMPFRILDYCYEIIRDSVDKSKLKTKGYKLPSVVPILLYTGKRKWKMPDHVHTILSKKIGQIGISVRYLIVDITTYSKEKLLNSNSMVGYAMQAERCKTKDELDEVFAIMANTKPNSKEDIIRMIKYLYKDTISDEELQEIKHLINVEEVKKSMETIRTRIAEWNRQTFLQGISQGIKQENKNRSKAIAKKMLSMGIKNEVVKEATGLSKKEIEELSKTTNSKKNVRHEYGK